MEMLGQRLKELRLSVKLSQKKMAEILGTQQTSINRYETNQYDPPTKTILVYADYFDVSIDYLFGRTDNPQGRLYKYEPKALKVKAIIYARYSSDNQRECKEYAAKKWITDLAHT